MKTLRTFLLIFLLGFFLWKPNLSYSHEDEPPEDPPPYETPEFEDKPGGWFIGVDQGILFFVGESESLFSAQYFSSFYGGYSVQGIVGPMIKMSQAFGSLDHFSSPTTYFFMFEGGLRITPMKTMVSPFIEGSAGFYVLNFTDFGSPTNNDTNFTFSVGGGLEVAFGASRLTLGSTYRGFINSGQDLRSVTVTLGYGFQF